MAARLVEVFEQLLAFAADGGNGSAEPVGSGVAELDEDRAAVAVGGAADDQAGRFGSVHEFGDGALGELEILCQLPDRAGLARVRGTLDCEQQEIALRRETDLAHGGISVSEEPAQNAPELRRAQDLVLGYGWHTSPP